MNYNYASFDIAAFKCCCFQGCRLDVSFIRNFDEVDVTHMNQDDRARELRTKMVEKFLEFQQPLKRFLRELSRGASLN